MSPKAKPGLGVPEAQIKWADPTPHRDPGKHSLVGSCLQINSTADPGDMVGGQERLLKRAQPPAQKRRGGGAPRGEWRGEERQPELAECARHQSLGLKVQKLVFQEQSASAPGHLYSSPSPCPTPHIWSVNPFIGAGRRTGGWKCPHNFSHAMVALLSLSDNGRSIDGGHTAECLRLES